MNDLHEAFARASAWLWPALANHLWQATLFAALVLLLTLALRRAAARTRFALWLVAAAKFVVPAAPLALLAERAGAGSLLPAEAAAASGAPLVLFAGPAVPEAPALAAAASGTASAAPHAELFCALTLLWLAGSAVLLAVWLGRRREFLRSLGGGAEVWSGREFDALRRAGARLGLGQEVLLALSAGRTEPGVWRTRRPVVVLPAQVVSELDDEELETVLLHELAHVERRDNFFGYFQTVLECVFWFNPAVWLVGRRLLAERERACDERVLEAGGAAGAYAAGILKVVRFCSGWRVAGVSGAASGSNLRRRIEMIMREERGARSRLRHRAAVCGLAAAALALTAGAGLMGRAPAAEARMLEAAEPVPQQVVRTTRAGRAQVRGQEPGPATREVEQAAESLVYFEHRDGEPVSITEARMRQITRDQLRRADDEGADYYDGDEDSPLFVTLPTVTLANTSGRVVREVGVGYTVSGHLSAIAGYAVNINPGESRTVQSHWRGRNVIIPGGFGDVKVSVAWVTFADGTHWGMRAREPRMPPPPPNAPDAPGAPDAPDPGPRAGVGGSRDMSVTIVNGRAQGSGAGQGEGDGGTAAGGSGRGGGSRLGEKVYAPSPSYPPIAKAAGAQGTVSVRVTVDEEGNVVAARAVSGHPLLQAAAVDAARVSKFKPVVVDGKPVRVSGLISYNFVIQ